MDDQTARQLISAERDRVRALLTETTGAGSADRASEDEQGGGGWGDNAAPLTAELTSDAVASDLRTRLAALDRAEQRLDAGTFGLSVRSGLPIPDERLEADPAAELTVEEASTR